MLQYVEVGTMFEMLFYAMGFLAPVLLPVIIIVWFARRRTKKRLHEYEHSIDAMRGEMRGINSLLQTVEENIYRLTVVP
jgi:hypothetical protein